MIMLSPHFSLAELTRSDTAARYGIDNRPDAAGIEKLRRVCTDILEPVRAQFGRPVIVNSGYRSPALNARIPGASNGSQHTLCEAADLEVPGVPNHDVALWIAGGSLPRGFGQLILENHVPGVPSSGWVHCSLPTARLRGQVLTMQRVQGRTVYLKGLVV